MGVYFEGMGAYFSEADIRRAAVFECRKSVLKKGQAAVMEGYRAATRTLVAEFDRLFGNSPQDVKAQMFLSIMLEQLETVTKDLCEAYECEPDDLLYVGQL